MPDRSLEELWETAPRDAPRFDPVSIASLPPSVRRYLEHTIEPGAVLARSALVRMEGTIRLGGDWRDFEAEQVLRWDRGFVWRARTSMKGLPVSGADRFVDGDGSMRWKMLGLVPVMTASGPQISRAAAGRFHAEALWLPGALVSDELRWSEVDPVHPHACIRGHGEQSDLDLTIDKQGAVRALSLPRWYQGTPETPAHYEPFGGRCGVDRTFDGITIPTRYQLGWFWGTDRWEDEGEFFRCTLTSVAYR